MSACNLLNVFTGLVLQPAVWIRLHPCVDHGEEDRWSSLHGPFPNMHKAIKNEKLLPPICVLLTLKVTALSAVDLQRLWCLSGHSSQGEHTCLTVVSAVFLHGFHLSPPETTAFPADWNQQWAPVVSGVAKIVLANKLKCLVIDPNFLPWFNQSFLPKEKALFLTVILPYLKCLSNEWFSQRAAFMMSLSLLRGVVSSSVFYQVQGLCPDWG